MRNADFSDFSLFKVDGDSNPGGLFAKASVTHHRIRTLPGCLGCRYRDGRAAFAFALGRIPGKERSFALGPKKRWCNGGEEPENMLSEDEATDILTRGGLPHSQSRRFTPTSAPAAVVEVPGSENKFITEGRIIGAYHRGRGGVPERWRTERAGCGGGVSKR